MVVGLSGRAVFAAFASAALGCSAMRGGEWLD
jgi:hypothetical protein